MGTSFWSWFSPLHQISCINPIICSLLLFFPISDSVYFEFTDFAADQTNIVYSGDAKPSGGAIEFNKVNKSVYRVAHTTYADGIQIWDSESGKLSNFTTDFTFIVETQPSITPGHGFAFFLAPVGFQIPPNSGAGYLGLFNSSYTNSYRNKIVFVEFDSFSNVWDPPFPHVGINNNWLQSANSTAWNTSLHSGDPADVTVSYNGDTQMLTLSWRYGADNTSRENTSLSYQVDLKEVLPEWVTIGFSAATGRAIERHILQYWQFNSSLNIDDKNEDKSNKTKIALGITVPLGILVLGGLIACAVFCRKKNHSQKSQDTVALTSMNDDLERGTGPKRFTYEELVLATNNFTDDRKLGEGGFGCVYKGYLSRDGMEVAVKKISQGSKQGKKEYITEVKIISSLRHRNLVQLMGWCHDQTQFLLVYEFLPNRSLDYHIFNKKTPLKWNMRYKIATGLASALLYLHEECEQCVVHRDIKASNIMLDLGFNVKLGDFGLARIMDHELGLQTTGLAGTFGYMSPEYIATGKANKESDVYSFGVVALEIACGRKVSDIIEKNSDKGLVQWVWELLGKGQLLSCVDQTLGMDFVEKEVECLMMVGLWCAHPDRNLRPSIRQAIQVLKFEAALPILPMKMPVAMYYASLDAPEVSISSATMTSSSSDLVR